MSEMAERWRTVTADDGCAIAVRESGSENGPAVLLVHALAMDASQWDGVIAALDGAARVLALDCRGHGRSGKPVGPYTDERFARDIATVLDVCASNRAVVAGCSMGGTVAQRFAGRNPDRLAGLLLLDTTCWYGPEAPANWEQRASKAEREGMASLLEFQLERWFTPGFGKAHPEVVERAVEIFLRNDTAAYGATCRMLGAADERAVIRNFSGPAIVAVGEEDYATPLSMAKELAAAIPASSLRVIESARHFTPFEQPGVIAGFIRELLR